MSDTQQAIISNYSKVKEFVVATYQEADEIATRLFEPFGKPDKSGSRTSDQAKVRIRHRRARDEKGESFRVVLFQHNSLRKPEPKPEPEPEPEVATSTEPYPGGKHQRQHRRDRKGRKHNS